jgi:hypothetical protein
MKTLIMLTFLMLVQIYAVNEDADGDYIYNWQ